MPPSFSLSLSPRLFFFLLPLGPPLLLHTLFVRSSRALAPSTKTMRANCARNKPFSPRLTRTFPALARFSLLASLSLAHIYSTIRPIRKIARVFPPSLRSFLKDGEVAANKDRFCPPSPSSSPRALIGALTASAYTHTVQDTSCEKKEKQPAEDGERRREGGDVGCKAGGGGEGGEEKAFAHKI